jgi:hypothetical protein
VPTPDRRFAGLLPARFRNDVAARLWPRALRAAARAAAYRAGSHRASPGASARNRTRPDGRRSRTHNPNFASCHALAGSTRRDWQASRRRLRLDRDPPADARSWRHLVSNGSSECGRFPDNLSAADYRRGPYSPDRGAWDDRGRSRAVRLGRSAAVEKPAMKGRLVLSSIRSTTEDTNSSYIDKRACHKE